MLEHKQPGKHAASHDAGHAHHAPGPGKHTQVEQAHASAASVSTTASQSASFHEGNVRIDESVSVKLAHGRGPVSVDVSGGGLSVGDDHVGVDFKSSGAATGHALKTTGASVTTTKIGSQQSAVTIKDGYIGLTYSTSWTVKHADWSATVSVSAFVGTKAPAAKPKEHHGIVHSVIHAIGHAVSHTIGAVAQEVAKISKGIVTSAPDWGPYLVAAIAAVAAAGESIATG